MKDHPTLNTAMTIARAAGRLMMRYFSMAERIEPHFSAVWGWSSNAHLEVAQLIVESLTEAYPDQSVHCTHAPNPSQERDPSPSSYSHWIIDPIVGTRNYLSGIEHFALSMTLLEDGKATLALIYHPVLGTSAYALEGRGSQFESRRLRVRTQSPLSGSVVRLGFGHRLSAQTKHKVYAQLLSLKPEPTLHSSGCVALDLLELAQGKVDACYWVRPRTASLLAATLIVTEAGGLVRHSHSKSSLSAQASFFAAAPYCFDEIRRSLS